MLVLLALLLEDVQINDFGETSVVDFVDLDWLSSNLFRDQLIVAVHEAIDHNLIVLEYHSADDTIWGHTNGIKRLVVTSVVVHDLNDAWCFLGFGVVDVLLYLARPVPDSATAEATGLGRVVPIATRDELLEVPNLDHLSFINDGPLLIKLVVNTRGE